MLSFSDIARYGAIHEISCYITLKRHNFSVLFIFPSYICPKARVFHHRKKKRLFFVYRGDELQSFVFSSESEDEIANADDSQHVIYAMLSPCGTLMLSF